jgi:ankyrin repeat protein
MTVLQIAAKRGHAKVVKSLLDAGADTEEEMYETGQTALYLTHTPGIVELLIERGAIILAED